MEIEDLYIIEKKFINEIIKELENLELPPEWRPRDVLGFVIRKLQEREIRC